MFSLSLPLVLGFVSVLIDDCLPGLSEFKAVDYWRVVYLISTGSETYSGRRWVVSRGGSSIKNDKFVVVHLGVVVIRVASRIAILFFVNY